VRAHSAGTPRNHVASLETLTALLSLSAVPSCYWFAVLALCPNGVGTEWHWGGIVRLPDERRALEYLHRISGAVAEVPPTQEFALALNLR
jgi:hypothetical protein